MTTDDKFQATFVSNYHEQHDVQRASARFYRQKKQLALPPVEFVVNADGITWRASTYAITMPWHAVDRVFLTIDAVVFLSAPMALSVPKRALQGNPAVRDFVATVISHLSPQARETSLPHPAMQALLGPQKSDQQSSAQPARVLSGAFRPTLADLASAQAAAHHYIFTPRQRLVWIPMTLLATAVFATTFWLAGLIADQLDPHDLDPRIPFAVQTVVALAVALLADQRVFRPMLMKRVADWLNNRYPPTQSNIEVDATGISLMTDQADFSLAWSGVEVIFMTPTTVCFFTPPLACYMPARVFDAPGLKAFLSEALTHLSPQARDATLADARIQAVLRQ